MQQGGRALAARRRTVPMKATLMARWARLAGIASAAAGAGAMPPAPAVAVAAAAVGAKAADVKAKGASPPWPEQMAAARRALLISVAIGAVGVASGSAVRARLELVLRR